MQRFIVLGMSSIILVGCANMTPEQRQRFAAGYLQYQQTHPYQPIQYHPLPVPQTHTSYTNTNCYQYVAGSVQCQSTTTGN